MNGVDRASATHGEQATFTVDPEPFRVKGPVSLVRIPGRAGEDHDKAAAKEAVKGLTARMAQLQEILHASRSHAVLIVLQAMDAAGKDSTIRRCFGALNPQRCTTASFKQPTGREKRHDFLWRVHRKIPGRGTIGIFNRSHYEDVLVARVDGLVSRETWEKRYEHINRFERLLADESTVILKFYLHVSKDYQKRRLLRRLRRPDKRWKFNAADLEERKRWDDYMRAYEDLFSRCAAEWAPWYIIPSERRWYRDALICTVVTRTLERLNLRLPEPDIDPSSFDLH